VIYSKEAVNKKELSKNTYFENTEYGLSSTNNQNVLLEIIWTCVPAIILVWIAVPSISLLYENNKIPKKINMNVHITGNQWYWNYAYAVLNEWMADQTFFDDIENTEKFDHYMKIKLVNDISFDSIMILDDELTTENRRLLSVTDPLYLPSDVTIRLMITANDVIHSFALPKLGIKVDAVPGRLHTTYIHLGSRGIFYGQCSELCGMLHAFMPIEVRVVDNKSFSDEIILKLANLEYYRRLLIAEELFNELVNIDVTNDKIF